MYKSEIIQWIGACLSKPWWLLLGCYKYNNKCHLYIKTNDSLQAKTVQIQNPLKMTTHVIHKIGAHEDNLERKVEERLMSSYWEIGIKYRQSVSSQELSRSWYLLNKQNPFIMFNEDVCSANIAHVWLNGWPQFGRNYFKAFWCNT